MNEFPQKITDLPGLSEWEKYNGVEVDGKHYSPSEVQSSEALRSVVNAKSNQTIYRTKDGGYSVDPTAFVSFDDNTGKITINAPEQYRNDEKLSSLLDNNVLNNLSSNYKANKEVQYQDPYDETKKISTREMVDYLNRAVSDRVEALNAVPKAKSWLIQNFGNTKENIDAINQLTPEDMITMSATGVGENANDDSLVAIPKYIQDSYPSVMKLESYDNGFAKRGDLLNNWYNISNGSLKKKDALTIEKYASGNALTTDIKNMSGDEIARSVAFAQFLAKNDPTMSGWDAFWTNAKNVATGVNEGIYGRVATALDALVNFVSMPVRGIVQAASGSEEMPSITVKEFLWPEHKTAIPSYQEQLEESKLINSGGATALGVGYAAGTLGMELAEIAMTQAAFSAIGSKITNAIVEKGASKTAITMAKEAEAAQAMSKSGAIAQIGEAATKGPISGTTVGELRAATSASVAAKDYALFNEVTQKSYQIATKILGVTDVQLQAMSVPQMANVLNSAFKVIRNAKLANTALGVMSTMVISATVSNQELTDKIIRNPGCPAEVRNWVKQVAFDAAVLEGVGLAGKVFAPVTGKVGKALQDTPIGKAANKVSGTASKATEKVTDIVTAPYQKFRTWATNRKMEAQAMSKAGVRNTTLANQQAITEAEVRRGYRSWMQTQSTTANIDTAGANIAGYSKVPTNASVSEMMAEGLTASLGTAVYDPVSETTAYISPFAAAQAGEVRLRNIETDLGDVQTLEAQLISQFSSPEVEPVISEQMQEAANADTALLNMEATAGILPKETIKSNAKITKPKKVKEEPYRALYVGHSKEVIIFARRAQELQIETNKARALNLPLEPDTPGYGEALARFTKAGENLPSDIKNHIVTKTLPAYRRLEHSIVDYMMDKGLVSRKLINGLRSEAKWGKNGGDYLRAAAAKDMPKGTYIPRERFTQTDTVVDMGRDKILPDDEITWIGNGLNAMIREISTSEAYKRFLTAAKQAEGLVIRTVKSGEETTAASNIKEYKKDFENVVSDSIDSFKEDVSQADAISKLTGKKAAVSADKEVKGLIGTAKTPKLLPKGPVILGADLEHTRAAGIMAMDGIRIREIMSDNKVPTSDMIVDQTSFDNYYIQSSDAAKKVLASNFSSDVYSEMSALSSERGVVDFDKMVEMNSQNSAQVQQVLDEADKLNAYDKLPAEEKTVLEMGKSANKNLEEFRIDRVYDIDFSYEVKPVETKTKGKRGDNLKYKLDENRLLEEIDYAIDGMVELASKDLKSKLYIEGANKLAGYKNSDTRTTFYVLSELLNNKNVHKLNLAIETTSKKIVDFAIPPKTAIIKGNLESLYQKTSTLMKRRFVSRLSDAKSTLEAAGETAQSDTVGELLKKYDEEIMGYKSQDIYVQTTNPDGETEWLEVTPAVGKVYNKRPIYKPMGPIQETLANMALLKRISLTNLSPRSFAKQAASDPALAFATTGMLPIPGMYTQTVKSIAATFGPRVAADIAKYDPRRYENIKELARRQGISEGEAAIKNITAVLNTQLPFTTMSQEVLRQADANRYGPDVKPSRRTLNDRINSGLRDVSEKLGTPNDKREMWTRQVASVKQLQNMLERGYNYAQAEEFARHALDNATTNFRQKHAVFNALRSSTPYLTAGVSGAKSFWQMFELDPIGVTTRILTGFVIPIMWLMGEVMEDKQLREQYESLAEYEKEDHIIIAINGNLVRIPIGEELGSIVNPLMHIVENIYNENQYNFWSLMLNDLVGFFPVDLTGFTDPEMWDNISEEAPTFLEVLDNGVSKVLASTMPPILQSSYMAVSQRDLYTGKKIDTSRVHIDKDGNAVIDSWSQSEFSKGVANVIGGDARVIEKVTSGIFGTTALHVLDTITSAVDWFASGGKSGSLTTAIEKTGSDLASHYAVHGYNSLDKRWTAAVSNLYDMKERIENDKTYKQYNEDISKETDPKTRQNKINGRNGMLSEFQNRVETLVKKYKAQGGSLNGLKFSQVASLLTFEDATRADRTFMHLNTEYSNARKQALQTLYSMGIKNPEGTSMLGYVYLDKDGHEQVKVWTPAQMQIINDIYRQQGDIHTAHITAIVEDGSEGSVKKLAEQESKAEQPYWDKYNSTGKLSNAEWNAIDDLRKAYNAQLVIALRDYIDTYGAGTILNNETVLDYLENKVKVPSEYEKVNGRYISSGDGKLNKQQGFARSYLKTIFGVK